MKTKAIAGILHLLFVLPIWMYLVYQILVRVNASELMFFLYWVYLPATVIVSFLVHVVAELKD